MMHVSFGDKMECLFKTAAVNWWRAYDTFCVNLLVVAVATATIAVIVTFSHHSAGYSANVQHRKLAESLSLGPEL